MEPLNRNSPQNRWDWGNQVIINKLIQFQHDKGNFVGGEVGLLCLEERGNNIQYIRKRKVNF